MTYSNQPTSTTTDRRIDNTIVGFGDRVHWGSIIAGLVIALSTQLLLSALGLALGFSNIAGSGAPRSDSGDVAQAVGVWTIISLFISLFIGGWITARACGSINRSTAALNGAILWATTLAISSWLVASGVSGAFGIVANNAGNIVNQAQQNGITAPDVNRAIPNLGGTPNSSTNPNNLNTPTITAQQTRDIAGNGAKAGWGFTFGALLGLAAATIGASTGARSVHTHRFANEA
jgi:hypothetical protein